MTVQRKKLEGAVDYNQMVRDPLPCQRNLNPIVISDEIDLQLPHDLRTKLLTLDEVDQQINAMRQQMREQDLPHLDCSVHHKQTILRKMEAADLMAHGMNYDV